MRMDTEIEALGIARPDDDAAILLGARDFVTIKEAFWGYVVGQGEGAIFRARLAEALAAGLALFFGTAAFAIWLMPSVGHSALMLPFKLGITGIFFAFAGLLYLTARRGLMTETQIDTQEQTVRIVRRNRADVSMTLDQMRFTEVLELFLKRRPGAFMQTNLCARVAGQGQPVVIATGPERVMTALREKLTTDISPRRLAKRQVFSSLSRGEVAAKRPTSRPISVPVASN